MSRHQLLWWMYWLIISYYHFHFIYNYSSCTRHASSTRVHDVMIVRYPVLSVTLPNKVWLIVVFLRADLSLWLCCFLSVSLRVKMIVVSVFSTIVYVSSKLILSIVQGDAGFSFINESSWNDIIITFDVIKFDRTSQIIYHHHQTF